MSEKQKFGTLAFAAAVLFALTGCSHAVFQQSTGGGNNGTSPVILTLHDTAASGITITSFELTVTGATLTPTAGAPIPLLSTPQTIELTQLQANSAFLSSTQVNFGSISGMTITFSNAQFTFINNTGAAVTVGTVICNPGASCVVTPTISGASNITFSGAPFPFQVAQDQQNLLEVDLNLGNIVQSDFSVNFGATGAGTVTKTQTTVVVGATTFNVFNTIDLNGSIGSVDSTKKTFTLAASTGQNLTIAADNSTGFIFGQACTANDFTCLTAGRLVDVQMVVLSDGSLLAKAIRFDDASATQQLTGEIVALNGTPPTSFTMVVHNEVPSLSSAPLGTPIDVTIGNTATFGVNNFSPLPSGVSFASSSDLLVGQEVEARLSGTFSAGPPPSFTTDRIMLAPTQITAPVASVSLQVQMFVISPLPSLFTSAPTNAFTQIQIDASDTFGTVFQNLPSQDLTGLRVGQQAAVAGFLFNTISSSGSPTIVAVAVRDDGP